MMFPLRMADQLQPHLRALRKRRSLTQAQLGALVGVKQARIAEIEANPGAVSLDQLTRLLAVLGGTLHLHAADDAATAAEAAVPLAGPAKADAAKVRQRLEALAAPAKTAGVKPAKPARATTHVQADAGVTIPAKKGIW